jgi:hypothetical protein
MKAGEPGTAAARPRLGPRAGGHRLKHGQAAYLLWMGRRERERCRPAPVLSGEQDRAKAELGDEAVQIVGTSGDVVGQHPRIRVPESAQVHGDDGVVLGQPGHDISPCVPRVREPVQQNDRRPRTAGHEMHSDVIHQPSFTGKSRRRSRGRCEPRRTWPVRSRPFLAHRLPAACPQGLGGINHELACPSQELPCVRLGRVLIEGILGRPDLIPKHPPVIVRVKTHLEAHHPAVLPARRIDQPVESLAHLALGAGPCRQLHD